jgi:hypothetical protein
MSSPKLTRKEFLLSLLGMLGAFFLSQFPGVARPQATPATPPDAFGTGVYGG